MNVRCMIKPAQATESLFTNDSFPLEPVGKGKVTLTRLEQHILLNHVVIVDFGPLKDVLLAHNI